MGGVAVIYDKDRRDAALINKQRLLERGLDDTCNQFGGENDITNLTLNRVTGDDIRWIVELLNSHVGKISPCLTIEMYAALLSDNALCKITKAVVDMPRLKDVTVNLSIADARQAAWLTPILLKPTVKSFYMWQKVFGNWFFKLLPSCKLERLYMLDRNQRNMSKLLDAINLCGPELENLYLAARMDDSDLAKFLEGGVSRWKHLVLNVSGCTTIEPLFHALFDDAENSKLEFMDLRNHGLNMSKRLNREIDKFRGSKEVSKKLYKLKLR